MHCTNAVDSEPSCQGCRKRFSTLDLTKISDIEWSLYAIASFLEKYENTHFLRTKSGRKIGCSAWGTLLDPKNRWGFEMIVKTGAGQVSENNRKIYFSIKN